MSNNLIDPSLVHLRYRPPPLVYLPKQWHAPQEGHNPSHFSHCDRSYGGLLKWSPQHPDMYSRSRTSNEPDWYNRRICDIKNSDRKNVLWSWEITDKPHEKQTYGYEKQGIMKPIYNGYQAIPSDVLGNIQIPKWGIYHPPCYQERSGVEHSLPPLHTHTKHL